jgi:hypothetical protein
MRHGLVAAAATLATMVLPGVALVVGMMLNAPGGAIDADARGAPGILLLAAVVFVFYFFLGRVITTARRPLGTALLAVIVASLLAVGISCIVWVSVAARMDSLSTYLPWGVGAGAVAVCLTPGALLQVRLLRPSTRWSGS